MQTFGISNTWFYKANIKWSWKTVGVCLSTLNSSSVNVSRQPSSDCFLPFLIYLFIFIFFIYLFIIFWGGGAIVSCVRVWVIFFFGGGGGLQGGGGKVVSVGMLVVGSTTQKKNIFYLVLSKQSIQISTAVTPSGCKCIGFIIRYERYLYFRNKKKWKAVLYFLQ